MAGSEDAEAGNFLQQIDGLTGQGLVVLENGGASDPVNVVGGGTESDGLGNGGRAGLEAVGGGLEFAVGEADAGNHFAPAVEGFHGREDVPSAPKDADPGRAAHFVAGERQKIAAEFAHVEREVAGALRRINQRSDPGQPRPGAEFGGGIDRAERVRDVNEGENFHRAGEEFVKVRQIEESIGSHRDEAQACAFAFGQELPRHEVAVMLHLGEENDVARAHMGVAPGAGHQVDALGRAAGEDDLVRRRADVGGQAFAGTFVGSGGAVAQFVQAAVDVAVVLFVIVIEAIQNGSRLLRSGGVVEIDEWVSVDLLVKNREIPADRKP